ncbi:MAG: MFS transporter [Clostridiales bacterium]|nr:MFS transporter [Clostridiales bacterium]
MLNPYIWLMSLGHVIADLGHGVLPIITPLLTEKLDLNFFQVGIIALAFTFSSAIIQPILGVLSDRYSMPWLMPLSIFLSGFGLALTGVVNSYGLLLFVILVGGIGVAGYHPEGSKMTHLMSEEEKAGASMAIFSVGGNVGFALGPMFAVFLLSFSGLKSILGFFIPGFLISLVFLYLSPRFNTIMKGYAEDRKEQEKLKAKVDQKVKTKAKKGDLVLVLLYVAVRSWIHSGLVYFIPFYFPAYKGVTEPEYLMTILLIAGALGTLVGGPLTDRFGGRNCLLVSMVLSLATIYPFVYFNSYWITIFAFIAGAAIVSTFSITVVLGQRLLPGNVGLASGLVLGFAVGMGSIGVSILGLIADHTSLPFVMNILCIMPVAGIALALLLPKDKADQQ